MEPYQFNPAFFKDLCDYLHTNKQIPNDEQGLIDAKNRTLVGRLYYSILLKLREEIWEILQNVFYSNPKILKKAHKILYGRKVHSFIPKLLKELDLNHYLVDFLNLQAYRHAADYYIDPSQYKLPKDFDSILQLQIDKNVFVDSKLFNPTYHILTTIHLQNLEFPNFSIDVRTQMQQNISKMAKFISKF